MVQFHFDLSGQVKCVASAIAEVGRPGACLKDIVAKVLQYNEDLDLCYKEDTLPNSVRRAIYEHMGTDEDGVFVRDGRGYYRLSVRVLSGTVIHGDAWDVMRLFPDQCFDLIVTDPPWEALGHFRSMGTNPRMLSRGTFSMRDIDRGILQELARTLKDTRHAYLFFPALNAVTIGVFSRVMEWAREAGLRLEKVLVWDKKRFGTGYRYRYQHELILFLSKGRMRQLNSLGIPDVLAFPRPKGPHPAQKPVPLLSLLIQQSTDEDDLVLDCFAGSGATGKACQETGRRFVLVEVDAEWVSCIADELQPTTLLAMGRD